MTVAVEVFDAGVVAGLNGSIWKGVLPAMPRIGEQIHVRVPGKPMGILGVVERVNYNIDSYANGDHVSVAIHVRVFG